MFPIDYIPIFPTKKPVSSVGEGVWVDPVSPCRDHSLN